MSKISYEEKNGASKLKMETPTQEVVVGWIKRDLEAAHYFLGILRKYPEIIEKLGVEMFEYIKKTEMGAGIDHEENKPTND
ncbi:hypothetical protein [Blackfly microvirus SF02]|uniref:Uncharacterized protein n=1 Tax=Blackfly microvirus SF02 TaxID=2576452 RepID=A0A4P8PM11_9VIRU|nr:hypothetical protein [Blackfly microvirus SF02]